MTQSQKPKSRPKTKIIRIKNVGNRRVIIHNNAHHFWQDLYHHALTMSWTTFFGAFVLVFLLTNFLFALLYHLDPQGIANLFPNNLLGAFFFSVETMATVGYGNMHPTSIYIHVISTIEIMVGTANLALLTGITFARFSKPRARIIFANSPIMTTVDGKPCLMIRTANARHNFIVDVTAKLSLLQVQTSSEGTRLRRIHDLQLVRDHQPMFFLGWTIMHVIDETSPLYGLTEADFKSSDLSLVLILQGLDESTAQQMQSRQVYYYRDIKWQHRYIEAIYVDEDGASHIDYGVFHDTEEMPS